MPARVDFTLYLITDRLQLPAGTDLLTQVEAALRGGVRGVQLREKDLPPDALLPLARRLRDLTRAYNARLLINREVELAQEVDADGVHLGGDAMDVAVARRLLGPHKLIGVSTHQVAEVDAARSAGADFVTFGPVYATPSKLPLGNPVGLEPLRDAVTLAGPEFPVFALGGVTAARLPELSACGCRHIACIGAILHSDEAEAAARSFLQSLE